MQKLLVATTNQNKFDEIKELLSGIPYNIISLSNIPVSIHVEESGKTYKENAVVKAKDYGEAYQLLTLSDDSGLEVDELGGKPGIYSARYVEGTDNVRSQKILEEMQNVPEEKRTARYRIVIALYNPKDKKVKIFKASCMGKITEEPKGNNGFGYDPIFYSFDLRKTFAEAAREEKNRVSHRAKAIEKIRKWLIAVPQPSADLPRPSDL